MTQIDNSYKPLELNKMSRSQIITHFEHLVFLDPLGHKLTLSIDFLELVDLAKGKKDDDRASL